MIFGTSKEEVNTHIEDVQIEESDYKKLLGITLDQKLSLKHVRMRPCPNVSSLTIYCSIIRIFHERNLTNKRNKIHERAIRIAYKVNVSSFENLLAMDNSVAVLQKNLQLLMIEI